MQHNHHSFQMEHSPRGAEASFSLGWVGHGGGFSLEEGLVGAQDVLIGYLRDGVVHCLPYCAASEGALATGMADFIPTTDPIQPHFKPVSIRYFRDQEITRDLGLGTDCWQAEGVQFLLATPVSGIPDPETAPASAVKDAVAPAIVGQLTFDNTNGTTPMTAFFAVNGLPGLRLLEDETGGELCGVASRLGYGFAVEAARYPDVCTFADFNLEHAFGRPVPLKFRLAGMGGVLVEVPAGETLTLDIAFGWFRAGVVTTGHACTYLYTRYFADLNDVLRYALDRSADWLTEAREHDAALRSSRLNAHQQFLYAKSVHSYYGSTQLFLEGAKPRWVVNEGSCNMINTLDLTVDMAFFELRQHPWALRNVLDSFADEYCYRDELHFPDRPEAYPGGISFTHDQGTRNVFTPHGFSSYEVTDHAGCFSYMTHEELLNWTLCAALYVQATGDGAWRHKRAGLLVDCLHSIQLRDHPDPAQRDGVMDLDSNRCGRESEITTYDSLDPSLGQARRNTYMAVKCWAAYLALAQLLEAEDAGKWAEEISAARHAARLCADTVTAAFDEQLGYIPAILDGVDQSAIIPIIEALVYPDQLGLHAELALDGPYADFLATLKRHLLAVLVPGRCLFPDQGWKLSGNNDNSWMSKIFICQYVAQAVLGLDFGAQAEAFDRAHADWWRHGAAGHSVIDQVVAGGDGVSGGCIYPRCVSSVLWLDPVRSEMILSTK